MPCGTFILTLLTVISNYAIFTYLNLILLINLEYLTEIFKLCYMYVSHLMSKMHLMSKRKWLYMYYYLKQKIMCMRRYCFIFIK